MQLIGNLFIFLNDGSLYVFICVYIYANLLADCDNL